MTTETLFNNAELAQSAYSTLFAGNTVDQIDALTDTNGAGMTQTQAKAFAARYPDIVSQFTDIDTGFSATIFKSTNGELTLAIRGTEIGALDLSTDLDIAIRGAGYDQIIAMVNWWKQISEPVGAMVNQYKLVTYLLPATQTVEQAA